MYAVVVCGARGAHLFRYDAETGEQELVEECALGVHLAPALFSTLQTKALGAFANSIADLCGDTFGMGTPIILALTRDYTNRHSAVIVRTLALRGTCPIDQQFTVRAGGQLGFNEIIRANIALPYAAGTINTPLDSSMSLTASSTPSRSTLFSLTAPRLDVLRDRQRTSMVAPRHAKMLSQ